MKDAFGRTLRLDDRVIYAASSHGASIDYVVGEVVKLYRRTKTSPDKVGIKPSKSSAKFSRNPIVYSFNVVLLPVLPLPTVDFVQRWTNEVADKAEQVDPGDDFTWRGVAIGFLLGCGLTVEEAHESVDRLDY